MKILYGVQGTGNGHITRARVMSHALNQVGIDVDYLFSGRTECAYFDMQCFNKPTVRRGLTFTLANGEIKYLKTLFKNNLWQFLKEVKNCDVSAYDCILCDFEPITAWAAKQLNIPVIGIGHQYVFDLPVPQQKPSWLAQQILHHFAPTQHIAPLHWHHFNSPILPPIINTVHHESVSNKNHILVYLPFENQLQIAHALSQFPNHQFIIYGNDKPNTSYTNIRFKTLSTQGFKQDLMSCDSVIANAGFELSSEAMSLGKKLLVRPLKGQTEQHSNALAIQHLNYGHVTSEFNIPSITQFLNSKHHVTIHFPDVALYLAEWIKAGFPSRTASWYKQVWEQVVVTHQPSSVT